MYNLSKSSKKVSDLSVGDSIVVYAKGLPYQTKFSVVEYDTLPKLVRAVAICPAVRKVEQVCE